ncbi:MULTISPECIES: hypothetical protein [unclassified Sphingomonas]|uniref:hypothetical protein n=1 Tax=unclassified Sphingomonas TaxID=196159 RepID=UPI001F5ADA36|nr:MULTISPECIES: hypothetical protein [unclassified Sphingomonas]
MKASVWTCVVLAAVSPVGAVAQDVVQWSAPVAATGRTAYFPMGTALHLKTRTELNTKDNQAGDRFYLEVAEPVVYRGQVVVPAGSLAVGEVMRSEKNGYFGKRGQLDVRLNYVQTPSGPVRLSGRAARKGLDQALLAIGGGVVVAWPMLFIHGTSGRLPADTPVVAYLADDMRFTLQPDSEQAVAAMEDRSGQAERVLPARFDPSVFSGSPR